MILLAVKGDHDDRVCPLHSFKYIAELQHTIGSRPGEKPLLIRIDRDSGHGGGKPTAKVGIYGDLRRSHGDPRRSAYVLFAFSCCLSRR